jgi:ACT domain-containing protein
MRSLSILLTLLMFVTLSWACGSSDGSPESTVSDAAGVSVRLVVQSEASELESTLEALKSIQGVRVVRVSSYEPKIAVESMLSEAELAHMIRTLSGNIVSIYQDGVSSIPTQSIRLVVEFQESERDTVLDALRKVQGVKVVRASSFVPKFAVESTLSEADLKQKVWEISGIRVNVYEDGASSGG